MPAAPSRARRMLAYALYAQYGLGLEPCPLCIFQRVALFALGCIFLAAALQHPRRRRPLCIRDA